ncbi:CaiF/GrlA family transcriptional regulator [Salmonella enterica]|nr:CaiF/GrlA family transcriptional regulator [Salmonella enterica]EJR4403551.1 CaiF/GrlA family transcriptional regulator [Salmonella enterica]
MNMTSGICPMQIRPAGFHILYQEVARWAMLQGRGVTVKEVSEAFSIPTRRASDILHYIVHNATSSIEASVSLNREDGNGRQKVVRVWRVNPQCFPQTENVAKVISEPEHPFRRRRKQPDREIQRLRTWFLSRRSGETIPELSAPGIKKEDNAELVCNGQNCGQ